MGETIPRSPPQPHATHLALVDGTVVHDEDAAVTSVMEIHMWELSISSYRP